MNLVFHRNAWAELWPWLLSPATLGTQLTFPSLLPTGATCSTAQLQAASGAKMLSITKHNRLWNEKAEKDSSLGQNMNHQKTTLAEIPIKGNVNNHPKPPAHSDTLVPMCMPAVLGWVRVWVLLYANVTVPGKREEKKKSQKNTRIILGRRAGGGNL